MSIVQTTLVFIGIPALIVLAITAMVYGKHLIRQPNRYRPGRGWDYPPAWFQAHPDALVHTPKSGGTTAVGGATGEW